jgi:hypothetical protein
MPWMESMRPICFVDKPKPATNLKGSEIGSSFASGVLKNTGSNWSKVIVWLAPELNAVGNYGTRNIV